MKISNLLKNKYITLGIAIVLTVFCISITALHTKPTKIMLHTQYNDKLFLLFLGYLIIETAILLYIITKSLHLPKSIYIILIASLCLRLIYLNYTNFDTRSHDVNDHINYIQYLANNYRLPPVDKGWEYHQTPLYYITGALVYKLANNFSFDTNRSLQLLSYVYTTIFLLAGILLLQLLLTNKWLFINACTLLTFWPSSIIHGIRIGNDPMYYMMCALSLYFIIKWLNTKTEKFLYLACVFSATTTAVKLSGLMLIPLICIAFTYQLLKKKEKKYLKHGIALTIIIITIVSLSFFRNVKAAMTVPDFSVMNGKSAISMNRQLAVKNQIKNFLTFDEYTFISQPFTTPWEDKGGREYFWNYIGKTMLFGEFNFNATTSKTLAIIMSILLIEAAPFFFLGLVTAVQKLTITKSLLVLYGLLSIVSVISFRLNQPFAPNQDFRYIVPAIIPGIYFYFSGLEYLLKHKLKLISVIGYILPYLFIICSCIFFLTP